MVQLVDQVLDVAGMQRLAFSAAGEAIASPLHDCPYLLLKLDAASQSIAAELVPWLKNQPCPVIGISNEQVAASLLDCCDLVVDSKDELDTIKRNILRAPLAAMTLVQVLRITENLSLAHALNVESLAYSTLQSGPEFASWSRMNPPTVIGPEAHAVKEPAVLIKRHGAALDITLNRPASRNAMSIEMRDALVEALQLVVADTSIHRVKLSGAGKCFSVGGDLREFGSLPDPASAHAVRSIRLPATLLIHCAKCIEFQLHGACIGAGAEIPAFGGRVVAAKNTFFQLPEIRFGLLPGAGGCVSIPKRIGRHRAAWLALSARRINAATALDWGLVDALSD